MHGRTICCEREAIHLLRIWASLCAAWCGKGEGSAHWVNGLAGGERRDARGRLTR